MKVTIILNEEQVYKLRHEWEQLIGNYYQRTGEDYDKFPEFEEFYQGLLNDINDFEQLGKL